MGDVMPGRDGRGALAREGAYRHPLPTSRPIAPASAHGGAYHRIGCYAVWAVVFLVLKVAPVLVERMILDATGRELAWLTVVADTAAGIWLGATLWRFVGDWWVRTS